MKTVTMMMMTTDDITKLLDFCTWLSSLQTYIISNDDLQRRKNSLSNQLKCMQLFSVIIFQRIILKLEA
jgi:hypothetical protein